MTRPAATLSRVLRMTEGQVWTVGLGLGLAAVLLPVSVVAVGGAPRPPGVDVPPSAPAPAPPGEALALPAPGATAPGTAAPGAAAAGAAAPSSDEPGTGAAPAGPGHADGPGTGAAPAGPGHADGPAAGAPAPESPSARPPVPPAVPPLRVVDGGWSAAAPDPAVPVGTLPVGARGGRTGETSYVRLAGGGTVLRLAVRSADSVLAGSAAVRACRLATDRWTAGEPGPGVPVRTTECAPGRVSGGVAAFDLSGFPTRTDRTGFALLPALAGDVVPRTFRLVLDPTAPAPEGP